MKRKVLEVDGYPPPHTGWAMRIWHLRRCMLERGIDCQVLNVGPNRKVPSPEYLCTHNGLDLVWKLVWWSLRRYRVHAHVNGDSPKGFVITFLGLFTSWVTGNRPILTFHAGPVQKYFPQSRAPRLTPYYRVIFWLARDIICNNQAVKDNIVGYGVPERKVHAIPAFSVQYLDVGEATLPDAVEEVFRESSLVISTYVYFRPEFFCERMVDAFGDLRDAHPEARLLVLGGETGSETVVARVRERGLEGAVHFLGNQDHEAFVTILRRSTLFLRTPVKDGVSTSVLEALYCGVPVVASENGSRPAGVITYDNEDLADMVAKMRYAIESREEVVREIVRPQVEDTITPEIEVLTR